MKRPSGWQVGKSIMLELCFGISAASNGKLDTPNKGILESWLTQWQSLWEGVWNSNALIVHLAHLSNSLTEVDYHKATLAARQLKFNQALARAKQFASLLELTYDEDIPDNELFVELSVATRVNAHKRDGFNWNPDIDFAEKTRQQYYQLIKILDGGELHEQFWQLVEQFYYEIYKPWRMTKLATMQSIEEQVVSQLGTTENNSDAPNIEWLVSNNSFSFLNFFSQEIIAAKTRIFFWVNPFSFEDSISIQADMLIISCNNCHVSFQEIQQTIEHLTDRLKAISDPTRITILNMIKFFSMDNTQMANALSISRPTVSVHTKILREAGLIESYQDGRSTKHRVIYNAIDTLISDINKYINLSKLNS